MNRKHGITVGTLVLVVLACAWHGGEAAADGVMMPPLVVDKLPDMPSQRAILVHRDGVETLVIESMFDGPGKEMAWILPVPAKPTKITQACSGLFTTLDLNLQPKVIDAVSPVLFLGLLFLFWFLFLVAAGRFVPLRALAMAVFVLFAICKDMAGNAKAGVVAEHKVPGVSSSGALTVGGYEVHVLEAEAPAALSQWLQANAFRDIPEAGKPVVSDYIAKKWQFVVARLQRESDGLSKPQPLQLSFASEKPVYPLRLTQLDSSALHLDLFVIADKEAAARSMHAAYSDTFQKWKEEWDLSVTPARNRARHFGAALGLPELLALTGDNCVITRLKADLSRRDMREDLYLDWKEPVPVRDTVYTARGARLTAVSWAVMLTASLLLAGVLVHYWRVEKRGKRSSLFVLVIVSLVLGGLVFGVGCWMLPQADILRAGRVLDDETSPDGVVRFLHNYRDILGKMSLKEIEGYFAEALAGTTNPYTGEAFHFEAAPGGLTLSETELGIVARTYDMRGTPHEEYLTGSALPALLKDFREHPEKTESNESAIGEHFASQGWQSLAEVRELMADPSPKLRRIAVDAVANWLADRYRPGANSGPLPAVNESAITLLVTALGDPDKEVRQHAVAAMSNVGMAAGSAAPVLGRLMDDPDEDMAKEAAKALGHLGKKALPQLLPRIAKTEKDAVRMEALSALGNIGQDANEAVPALMALLKEEVPPAKAPKVRINEVVCIGSTYKDEDGDTPDWFELYNEKEEAVNLEGWFATDDKANPKKWVFPAVSMVPGGYAVLYASGKDRRPADLKRLHTNFKLNDQGGEIDLFDPQGTLVDTMAFPAGQPGSSWCFFEDENHRRSDCAYLEPHRRFGTPRTDGRIAGSGVSRRGPCHGGAGDRPHATCGTSRLARFTRPSRESGSAHTSRGYFRAGTHRERVNRGDPRLGGRFPKE